MSAPDVIEISEVITLRALDPSSAPQLFAATDANRAYLGKYLPWVPTVRAEADTRTFIADCQVAWDAGEKYAYGIFVQGELVGHTSLFHLKDEQMPEIGYWVAESVSGKGYATQTARALTDLANSLELQSVCIRAAPKNLASNAIANKLGYTIQGTRQDEDHGLMNIWVRTFTYEAD